MNNAKNDHLILKLVNICFDDMLQILCKSLASLQKFGRLRKFLVRHILFGLVSYLLVNSNIVKTYETLLTYDFLIRNTDPRFHLVSCYKKHFWGYLLYLLGHPL